MAKAYDRVDWVFLEGVLAKLGFHSTWIQWVMACVTSVRFSIRFNGHMLDPFTPSRGIRQGDPLSPYLFLFVADGLSRLIRKEIESNTLREFHICRKAPGISHLLFADDCFLFFRAAENEAMTMKHILATYEVASGQSINLLKSKLFCSRNVQTPLQNYIANILGVQQVLGTGKYLGLPSMIGRSRKATFSFIKDRIAASGVWHNGAQVDERVMV
jgi:hypothetical protein